MCIPWPKIANVAATNAFQLAVELKNHPSRCQKMKRHSMPRTLAFHAAQSTSNTKSHVVTFSLVRCHCSICVALPKGVPTLHAITHRAAWVLHSQRTVELTFATTICYKIPEDAWFDPHLEVLQWKSQRLWKQRTILTRRMVLCTGTVPISYCSCEQLGKKNISRYLVNSSAQVISGNPFVSVVQHR